MSVNPQSESAFITRLPLEIRNAIYLELWRSCGLRQHIVWHGEGADRHFCRWPCTTEYHVHDGLQEEIEQFRRRLGVPLGESMNNSEASVYTRRLQSPWMNHWACGERAEEAHGIEAIRGFTTSGIGCWKKNGVGHPPARSPYLPMLLSCKLL